VKVNLYYSVTITVTVNWRNTACMYWIYDAIGLYSNRSESCSNDLTVPCITNQPST